MEGMRVVSLTCSNTEIVCALGCGELLVGVDDHSDFPPDVVALLPRVGPDLAIDVEAVAALEPDLVLASLTVPGHEKVVERLEQAGLPYVASEPVSLADVVADVRDVARRLGVVERGEAVVAEMEAALAPRPVPEGARRPTILVQWWPKPVIAPGRLSWVDELIERAGGRNPLHGEKVKSRPLTDEEVREMAPDAMVLSWCGVAPEKVRPDVVLGNPAWQELPFVREERVHLIPEAYLGRPSPRLVDGLAKLREVAAAAGRGRHE
jgi:iron complex transport system substrate-binding protein